MNLLVTGGAGFIGSSYVRLVRRARPDDLVVNVDALTYAGNLENLRDLEGDARPRVRARRHPRRRRDARAVPAPRDRRHRQLRRREPRRSQHPVGGAVPRHQRRRHAAPARGGARRRRAPLRAGVDRRGLRNPRPDRGVRGDHADLAAQPLLGQQGRRGPLRDGLPPHPRHGHRHHPLLEQLRPVPVPGEADPAHDPERLRGQAAAGLRRRPATSATGSTSRITARRSTRRSTRGRRGRGLQHRRGERAAEPGRRARDPAPHRPRRIARFATSPIAPGTTGATR